MVGLYLYIQKREVKYIMEKISMKLFNFLKKIDSETVKNKLIYKGAAKNSFLFVIGTLISALAFNLFFVPYNFVGAGLGGLSVVINKYFAFKLRSYSLACAIYGSSHSLVWVLTSCSIGTTSSVR